ncbi:hypothetical protein JHK87_016041 [Glycine soja]|nr:hypothetical protein JHK87_016041 [Glycine soja]
MGVDVWFGLTRSDSAIIRRNITQFWPRIEECRKQLENLCNSQEESSTRRYKSAKTRAGRGSRPESLR